MAKPHEKHVVLPFEMRLKMRWANEIGAFVRWLLKGCKTSLKDEIYYNDVSNLIVGLLFSLMIVLMLGLLFK